MSKAQWFCRYTFLVILLAIAVTFTVYCAVTVDNIEDSMNTVEFLDSLPNEIESAFDSIDNLHRFEDLLEYGIISCIAVGALIVLMIIYHIIGNILKKKLSERKMRKQELASQTASEQIASCEPPAETAVCEEPVYEEPACEEHQVQPESELYDPPVESAEYEESVHEEQPVQEEPVQEQIAYEAPAEAFVYAEPAAEEQPAEVLSAPISDPCEESPQPAQCRCSNCGAVFNNPTAFCGFCGNKL